MLICRIPIGSPAFLLPISGSKIELQIPSLTKAKIELRIPSLTKYPVPLGDYGDGFAVVAYATKAAFSLAIR